MSNRRVYGRHLLDSHFEDRVYATRGQMLATEPLAPLIPYGVYADFGYEYFWQLPTGEVVAGGWRQNHKDAEVKKGAWPDVNADKPVGEWNAFDITLKGETINLVLNGKVIAKDARMPGIPKEGPIVLQHHGGKNKNGEWSSASALVQFRNIWIRELK